jgi:hypothetical protein
VEVEVGPTELREFLGLPDVASVQQEALDALVQKVRSGAASGSDLVAVMRGLLPEGLGALGELQRLIVRAVQTGRPVTVETTVKPEGRGAAAKPAPRAGASKKKKGAARKKRA